VIGADGSVALTLDTGWTLAASEPGSWAGPTDAVREGRWQPACVPGTAAGAIGADPDRDFDAEDWWFRVEFEAPPSRDGRRVLHLGGVATVSEVFLNGELLLESQSMWRSHELDVEARLSDDEENELVIACRALRPLLARRRRPAARWRTRVVEPGNLRWFRTMMFGRSPGFAPGPAAVGPWRPVELVSIHPHDPRDLRILASVEADGTGVIELSLSLPGAGPDVEVEMAVGDMRTPLMPEGSGRFAAVLRIPAVEKWWPHTHGAPALHALAVAVDGVVRAQRRVGFRSLGWAQDVRRDGLDLHVNGIPVFARGAVWTPTDLVGLAPSREELRRVLQRVRDAGMNMLRVAGTGAYESSAFHDLCDELGIMVWQDLMFANVDYPLADPDFAAEVEGEARQVLSGLVGRPSLAVICGNSEVEQQAAMLGLEPELGRAAFWDEALPTLAAELGADCPYVASTPCGGALPFHPGEGIAHYFGVSGYFRPPQDARRAEVRFAAECLAFANVPDEVTVPVHHPQWKAGVVRDAGTGWDIGSGWDFDDVRDHYLRLLFDVDPVQLRRFDHARYLELSRFASAEVMAEVIGDWRRAQSPCRGALVLWLKDMLPGAGLGVLDHAGHPKVAYHHLRRAFAPLAVWCTDEGLAGVCAHIANDGPACEKVRLRVTLYRHFEELVDEAARELTLGAHATVSLGVEAVLGRWVDAAWAYRFGPPAQNVIALTLERPDGEMLSQAFHLPAGRPVERLSPADLGLRAVVEDSTARAPRLTVSSERFAYGVRVAVPGFELSDDAFSVPPRGLRELILRPEGDAAAIPKGTATAINMHGAVHLRGDTVQPTP
jgi:beta-mannosidase